MAEQLIKKTGEGYSNVMPKSWIEAITDKSTGESLTHILQGFNMYFLSYTGNTEQTRCQVPKILRKKGLWVTYVKYDGNVYTEWYNSNDIDDKSWGNSSNWRMGNNELVGDLTISANGNWVINGNETEFRAVGENGNTPILRVANNRLQVSYDTGNTYHNVDNNPVYTQIRTYNNKLQISTDLGANWIDASDEIAAYFRFNSGQGNNVGNIQISRNNKDWSNLSGNFVNNLHISKYIGANETLPTSGIAEGTIYAKGPTYAESDTSHNNPIYRLWVYAYKGNTLAWQDNGEFTSISAGVAQELGNSENLVVSQKCVSQEIIQGGVYDVSAHNNDAVFESLQTLLSSSNLSTLIPTSVRHGGMNIRFIQSSDNKYVQYRLTNQNWSIDVDDWQEIGSAEFSTGEKVSEIGIDAEPTAGSENLINSGSVATIQKGNLKKKSGITTIDLSISDFTLKYDLLATISNGHLVSSGGYNVYYKQMDVDSRIIYKLGVSVIQGNAAIFVCDTIPAANVSFSNTVERVANATGSFNIQRGQYLCIQSYSTINTYLPAYLKKEYDNYESVNIFDKLGEKAPDSTIKSDSVWGAIEEIRDTSTNVTEIKKIVPYMVDTMAFFWTHKEATNFNQNNPFKISGTANSNTLNVLSGGQNTSVLTSADSLASIVVKFDDGTCKPYMLTGWTEDTLTIYPTIDKNITDGEVVPLMNDSQHLTIYGYHAYSQHLFEENPRYCEKNKYIKRYNGSITSIRFSELSGTPHRYESSRNDNSYYSCQYGDTGIFLIPYTDHLTESQYGYQWEVSTKGIKGYLETYVGVCNGFYPANTFTLDEGYEIHIEGWIDGVKSYEKIKDNIFIERICIPFEKDNDKVKIKIYLTKMRNSKDTLYIGATTFWVNESSRTNMIEQHEIVSQLFDSWGDYDATDYIEDEKGNKWYQGSSGKELQRLINDKNGIIIPYFNRSRGSMTTRWGKSWWYHNVWSIHTDIMLTDFGINDYHTNISQTFPNFKDPYGNIISMATPVTATEFAQNMETLFDMCIRHNIIPIYVMCSRIGCDNVNYINTFVNNHAQQLSLT